jgi:hypothetical protein
MRMLIHICNYQTGECLGSISTLNYSTLENIDRTPSQYVFEPKANNRNILWAKYFIKDIKMKVEVNYQTVKNELCYNVVRLIFVEKYYVLYFNSLRAYWKKL